MVTGSIYSLVTVVVTGKVIVYNEYIPYFKLCQVKNSRLMFY